MLVIAKIRMAQERANICAVEGLMGLTLEYADNFDGYPAY